jgi:hypothetical protein
MLKAQSNNFMGDHMLYWHGMFVSRSSILPSPYTNAPLVALVTGGIKTSPLLAKGCAQVKLNSRFKHIRIPTTAGYNIQLNVDLA